MPRVHQIIHPILVILSFKAMINRKRAVYNYSDLIALPTFSGFFLAAELPAILLLAGPAQAQFAGGSGTAEDPYQIENVEQLQDVGQEEYQSSHFILIADIDASETAEWHDGDGFEPIWGFAGSLNGAGHIISNLVIDRKESWYVGLFSHLDGYIENLGLEKVNIIGDSHVGGLAGSLGDGGIIKSTYITGKVTGNEYVGGLVVSFLIWILNETEFTLFIPMYRFRVIFRLGD